MRLAAILAKHFADSRIVGTGNGALLFFGVIRCRPGWPHCQWLSDLGCIYLSRICLLNSLSALYLLRQREAEHCHCPMCPA